MGFYDELGKVYDIVFKKSDTTTEFLNHDLNANSDVLDLACGTGTYAVELAKKGHNVTGVDLDSEMIRLAKVKAGALRVAFLEGDMRAVKVEFGNKKYDMIYCIGNSLVHLQDRIEVETLIKDIYELLNEKGILVIQIINYDRVIKENIQGLPTIDRSCEGVKFIRNYRHGKEEGIIYFETELRISKDGKGEVFNNSVPLLPLQSGELKDMISRAGFSRINAYGEFSGEEFNEKSYALVIRAYK